MAPAYDAFSTSGEFTAATDPKTWTHTPVGTPRGIVVMSTQVQTAADYINGPVLYGGVALTRVQYAIDNLVEAGAAWAYFLGSGIPTGPQTVSIDHDNGIFGNKHAVCVSITGSGDMEVVTSGKLDQDATNPTVTLDSGSRVALKLGALFSGRDLLSNITVPSGITRIDDGTSSAKWSADAACRCYFYRTTPGTGSETVGMTAASDDSAIVGLAIAEVVAGAVIASYQLANLANLARLQR